MKSKVFKPTRFKELKKEYKNVIYAGNGLYICYIKGIGWDLYDNKKYISTFLDFNELINIYQLITQGGKNE